MATPDPNALAALEQFAGPAGGGEGPMIATVIDPTSGEPVTGELVSGPDPAPGGAPEGGPGTPAPPPGGAMPPM